MQYRTGRNAKKKNKLKSNMQKAEQNKETHEDFVPISESFLYWTAIEKNSFKWNHKVIHWFINDFINQQCVNYTSGSGSVMQQINCHVSHLESSRNSQQSNPSTHSQRELWAQVPSWPTDPLIHECRYPDCIFLWEMFMHWPHVQPCHFLQFTNPHTVKKAPRKCWNLPPPWSHLWSGLSYWDTGRTPHHLSLTSLPHPIPT